MREKTRLVSYKEQLLGDERETKFEGEKMQI